MAPDVAPLPREPDALIGIIVDLRDENDKLRAMLETLSRALFGARSERLAADPAAGARARGLPRRRSSRSQKPAKPRGSPAPAPSRGAISAVCPSTCRARTSPSSRRATLPVLPGQAASQSARTSARCSTSCRRSCGSYGSGVRATAAGPARAPWCRRRRRRGRSNGGLPTSALLAHVAVSKFAWHIPLHRQTQMMAAYGIELDRSTLVHWIERAAWWLRPLHALLTQTVMSAPKIFCDDTPLPVLDRTRRRTRLARIWCYAVDDRPWQGPMPPAVVYLYAEDRRGCHIDEHLDGFQRRAAGRRLCRLRRPGPA